MIKTTKHSYFLVLTGLIISLVAAIAVTSDDSAKVTPMVHDSKLDTYKLQKVQLSKAMMFVQQFIVDHGGYPPMAVSGTRPFFSNPVVSEDYWFGGDPQNIGFFPCDALYEYSSYTELCGFWDGELLLDPHPFGMTPFLYAGVPFSREVVVLISRGPDGDRDILPEDILVETGMDVRYKISLSTTAVVYDPTNGSDSSGDIIMSLRQMGNFSTPEFWPSNLTDDANYQECGFTREKIKELVESSER